MRMEKGLEMCIDRKNCWEIKQCARGPGDKGPSTCVAALPSDWDGINGGDKGGRFCWSVAGALCGSQPTGSSAAKLMNCFECDFFKQVQEEEAKGFMRTLKDARDVLGTEAEA